MKVDPSGDKSYIIPGLLRRRLRESWRALRLLHLGLQFAEVIMDLKQECNSNDIGTGNQIQHTKQMSQNQSQSLCSEGLSSSDEICAALDKFSNIFKKVMERFNKNMEKLVEILSKKDEMVLQFIVDELVRMGLPFAD